MRIGAILISSAALALAGAAGAQQRDGNDIVVTAPQIEEAARAFAREVSTPPEREDQLPRFEGGVCPGVVGIGQRQGQFLVDRIARRALEVGLEVGRPGCEANLLVIVTRDAEATARTLAEEERYLMANYGLQENLSTRGSDALIDFVETPRPVRWWHVAQTQTADGDILGNTPNPNSRIIDPRSPFDPRSFEFRGVEVARSSGTRFGRLARPTLQSLRNVVVIVDAWRARRVRLRALGDYIAMVALAQTDPAADTAGYDTILNLFSDQPAGQAGMTAWDLAYLQGLYAGHGDQVDAETQARTIGRRMRDELAPPG